MQVSLDKPQPFSSQEVKNILIRSFSQYRHLRTSRYREISYILKYSPKYYRTLCLQITSSHPLLSKIKKIKKIKKLEGPPYRSFNDGLPQKLWFRLLAGTRKDIEEASEVFPTSIRQKKSLWKRLTRKRIKLLPNIARARWRAESRWKNSTLTTTEIFVHYIWHWRRILKLEVFVGEDNYDEAKWNLELFDEMRRFIGRLEVVTISITAQNRNVKELFRNKNVFSYATDLRLCVPFDPAFAEILGICKNLSSLSLEFRNNIGGKPELVDFFTAMRGLQHLKSIKLVWPEDARDFWSYFKPQSSLRKLTLIFNVSDLVDEGLFGEDIDAKDVVAHWEDIKELDVLEFGVSCDEAEEMIFVKHFVTMILKKVRRVRSLIYDMTGPPAIDAPFFIEEVGHLYESLESFEYILSNGAPRQGPSKFDLKIMKSFRNLRELRLEGGSVIYENVEEAVAMLEENQKEGAVLKIKVNKMVDQSWLGETLKKIEKIRRGDRKVEILFDLRFRTDDVVEVFERLCEDMQAVKTMKGLAICLMFVKEQDICMVDVERLKEILKKDGKGRDLKLILKNASGILELNGENEL